MNAEELLVVSSLDVQDREDEVLLIKQLEVLLQKVQKRDRVTVLICLEDRKPMGAKQ